MKRTLFLLLLTAGLASAESITLPPNTDFTWVPGSKASGIGTGANAAIVQNLANAIGSDKVGWFGGTGQGYSSGDYGGDISIINPSSDPAIVLPATSFTFTSRPVLTGEYVALGVVLDKEADEIKLTFSTTQRTGYSLWSYDGTTAKELITPAAAEKDKTVSSSYSGTISASTQLFVVWNANFAGGTNAGGGAVISVTNISLTYTSALDAGTLYWNTSGPGDNWTADASWHYTADDSKDRVWKENYDVYFTGTGEAVKLEGTINAASVSVSGSGWSWVNGTEGSNATLDIAGKLFVRSGAGLEIKGVSLAAGSVEIEAGGTLNLTDFTQERTFSNNGSVTYSGTIALGAGVTRTDSITYSGADNNGFASRVAEFTLFTGTGSASAATGVQWKLDGQDIGATLNATGDKLTYTAAPGTEYFITTGTVTYDAGAEFVGATSLVLNGGTLSLGAETGDGFISSTAAGGTVDLNGKTLSAASFSAPAGGISLTGAGAFNLDNTSLLPEKITLGSGWTGTVSTGDLIGSTALNLQHLSKAASTLQMGKVQATELLVGSADAVAASVQAGQMTLLSGDSHIYSAQSKLGALTLGSAQGAASLTVHGELAFSTASVTLGNSGSLLTAQRLAAGTTDLDFSLSDDLLKVLPEKMTLLKLTDASANGSSTSLTLNGQAADGAAVAGAKYAYTLAWDEAGQQAILSSDLNPNYVTQRYAGVSGNAATGASLLSAAFAAKNPQINAPDGALAALMNTVDDNAMTEEVLASLAGSAATVLSQALSGDVERQLRSLRSRASHMGLARDVVHEDLPYFNAWFAGEGHHETHGSEGLDPGYTHSSWGGTVGMDVSVSPDLTLGLAATAMFGKWSAKCPGTVDGHLNTYHVSPFAVYASGNWTHTFIATACVADGSMKRNVTISNLERYETSGDFRGSGFGFLYEAGYAVALNEDADACLQPLVSLALRHTRINDFTETGSDAALHFGSQTLTTFTPGVGARFQCVIGENLYNRTSVLELRALAEFDIGDRRSTLDVSLPGIPQGGRIRSARAGAFGGEFGAGIVIPLGSTEGDLFFDVSWECRGDASSLNGSVGYHVTF